MSTSLGFGVFLSLLFILLNAKLKLISCQTTSQNMVYFILCRCFQKPLHSARSPVTFPQWRGNSQSVGRLYVPFVFPVVSREMPFHPLFTSTICLGGCRGNFGAFHYFWSLQVKDLSFDRIFNKQAAISVELGTSPQYYRALSSWLEWGSFVY